MDIVKISEAALIAVHSAAVMAKTGDSPLSASQIALRIDASGNHVSKVMRRLVKAGVIKSRRGPAGGFSLAKEPEKISLLDVLAAAEGVYEPGGCPFRRRKCVFRECVFGELVRRFGAEFMEYAGKRTLAELKGA